MTVGREGLSAKKVANVGSVYTIAKVCYEIFD
jgi:hypothetical protein